MNKITKKILFGLVLTMFTCTYAYGAGYEIINMKPSYSTYANSYAYDLNENNEVVGYISNSITSLTTYDGEAFIYSEGSWADLGAEGLYGSEGINEFSQASGYGIPAGQYDYHAYIYDHTTGTTTDIGNLNGNAPSGVAVANDLNDFGVTVGYSVTGSGANHAFLYDGTMHDITTGSSYSVTSANAINNGNQVVGTIYDGNPTAFIWNATNGMTTFSHLTEAYSEAHDINDLGFVVGFSKDSYAADNHAFIALGGAGTVTTLSALPGDAESEAYGINNNNQVVGTSDGKAVMWQETSPGVWEVTDLNDLLPELSDWTLVKAYAINDQGSIVGYGRLGSSTNFTAFLLKSDFEIVAVPEPASIILLLGAVVGFAVKKSRKN